MSEAKKRNGNIELLRLLSMLMVVFLHALGKGNLLVDLSKDGSVNAWISWILESLSICAVNVFMLISGYFLIKSEFKLKRLIELVLQVMFYALGTFLVCLVFKIETGNPKDVYNTLFSVFPVHMDLYWFITGYIVIYMLQPLIKAGVEKLSKKQFETMLILLLIYECAFKSVLPVRLEEDEFGYNILWLLIAFLIGAYFRMYGFRLLKNSWQGVLLYIVSSALVFIENTALQFVTGKTGRLSELEGVSTEYNHIFVVLAAVGLFAAFINAKEMKPSISKIVCALSPMALGVYLIHENWSFRYKWHEWLGIKDSLSLPTGAYLGRLFLSVLAVMAVGLAVDYLRIILFKVIGGAFEKRNDS